MTASNAECIAIGVPAGLVGAPSLDSPAGQYNFLQGGKPDLIPEDADMYSYGIVFQPRWVPGLAITVLGANNILTACYSAECPAACALINRNPGRGQLWIGQGHVRDLDTSIGSLSTTGYDVNIGYTGLEMGRFGSLAFNVTGTCLDELITQPIPDSTSPRCLALKGTSSTSSVSTRRSA
jgi:hypothetical protein